MAIIPGLFDKKTATPKSSFLQEQVVGPAKTFAGGMYKASADLADTLDFYSDKISKAFGKPETKASIFEYLKTNWNELGDKLQKEGLTPGLGQKIYSGLGRATFDLPVKYMPLGGVAMPVVGAVEGGKAEGIKGAVKGGIEGGLMQGVIKGLNIMPQPLRLPTAFGVGAVTTPGSIEDKVASGAVFTGLSAPGKGMPINEFGKMVSKSFVGQPTAKILDKPISGKIIDIENKPTIETNVLEKPVLPQPQGGTIAPETGLGEGKLIYHGTGEVFKDFDVKKSADGSIWFTDNKSKIEKGEVSATGKGQIMERVIDEKKLKLGGWEEQDKFSTDELIAKGYDGLKLVDKEETTYQIFNPDKLSTPTGQKPLVELPKITTKELPLPEPIKPAVNINNLKISEEAKAKITNLSEQIKPELEKAKGKPLSHDEVLESAKSADLLTKTLTREQTKDFEAKLLRTRQALSSAASGKGVSKEFMDNLKIVSETGTDIARKLESFKISALPEEMQIKTNIVKELIKAGIDADGIIKASEGVDFNNPQQVSDFYRQFVKPKITEIIDEYRYINLLSSPKTHIVNTFSNILQVSGLSPATKGMSATIDLIGSTLTGKQRENYFREVPAYYKGMVNSLPEAITNAVDVIKGNRFIGRPDIAKIPTGVKFLKPFQVIPRALEASDVFFRTMAEAGEKLALTEKQKNNPKIRQNIDLLAKEKAAYFIFRKPVDISNKSGQGHLLSSIDKATNAVYSFRKVPGLKWFIPFVETPMNIVKQGIEYSPLGIATLPGNKNKPEQLAKSMIGAMVFAGAGTLALQGKTTWSVPKDKGEKERFYKAGMQPYSVKIGDKWVGYSKLGPLAYPIAMASAMKYYYKDNPKALSDTTLQKISKSMSGTLEFFSDQSYLEGIGNIVKMGKGDITASAATVAGLGGQLVPLASLQRWVTSIVDPYYRKADKQFSGQAIKEQFIKGIPGLSQTLPPITELNGQPAIRSNRVLNAFSPMQIGEYSPKKIKEYNLMQGIKQKSNYYKSLGDKFEGKSAAKTTSKVIPNLFK